MGVADHPVCLREAMGGREQGEREGKMNAIGKQAPVSGMVLRGVYLSHRFDAVRAFGGEVGEEFCDGFSEDRVTEVRGDFGEGDEDEPAVGESGMREREAGRVHDQVANEEQIEVEGAGPVGLTGAAIPAKAALGGEEEIEEGFGAEGCSEGNGGVHEGRLIREPYGIGAVERGATDENSCGGEVFGSGKNGLLGRAGGRGKVGAKSDRGQWGGGKGGRNRHMATVPDFEGDGPDGLCSKTMRIGFFGGSFDPPHRGHTALARLAMDRVGLAKVLFAPVGVQPLKRDRPQASFADRVAMTELAIKGEAGLELSEVDAPRADGRPNYTIDTVKALRALLATDDQLFCLMGADSFLSIGKWHRAADLLVTCDFVVAARPGFDLGRIAAALPESIAVAACDAQWGSNLALCLHGPGQRESRLYLLPELREPASASGIRESLQRGAEPRWELEPAVAAYIREHELYRDSRAS
jgi:nicotinate-nucleotide adenylyltransferase